MRNHNKLKIKICGIRDVTMVQAIIDIGVQMIGLIFDTAYIRHVDLKVAERIVRVCHQAGATPVAVFVNESAYEMQHICSALDIRTIQLHGVGARLAHHVLPQSLSRIYVIPLGEKQIRVTDQDLLANQLLPERDYVLLDYAMPGSGKSFDKTNGVYEASFNLGVAGGINSHNVRSICQYYDPTFIDVSSSVEISPGIKDVHLIKNFVDSVGNMHA